MEKRSKLILAHVDHVSGELLGFSVEGLLKAGARNVQLIPTITKKSRPGTILLIDVPGDREKPIAEFLARELKVSGYHRLDTAHVFQEIKRVKKRVVIQRNGTSASFPCDVKIVGDPAEPLAVDVEHDFLVRLQEEIYRKWNSFVSLVELRSRIDSKLRESGEEIQIEL
jgi:uncharacterized protein (DUF111 family)